MHNNVRARARRRGEAAVAVLVLAAAGFASAAALGGTLPVVAAAASAGVVALGQAAPAQAPAKPAAGPTAEEILAKAIERQGVPKGIDPAATAPLELSATTNLQYRDDKGNDLSLGAERKFLAPDRVWTQLTDKVTGTVTRTGYDGKAPWFWSKDSGVHLLNGPDSANDLKQLSNDVEITSSLARALQLRLLRRELSNLRRLDDATHADDATHGAAALWVVEGDAQVDMEGKKTPTKVRLFVAQPDAHLAGVRLAFEGRAPRQIWFSRPAVEAGFEFPRKIEVFRDGADKAEVTIVVRVLDLAPHLKDADFAPPSK